MTMRSEMRILVKFFLTRKLLYQIMLYVFTKEILQLQSRSNSCSRRDSADSAGEPVSAAQIGQSGKICDVLRRFTRSRGVRPGASYRSQTRAAAAHVRHYHYRRYLFHRVHPGRITVA